MKRIFLIFSAIAVLFVTCACSKTDDSGNVKNGGGNTTPKTYDVVTEQMVREHKVSPASDFEYINLTSYIMIDKYIGDDEIAVVPDTIDGLPVTEIGPAAFSIDTIKGVYLPKSIRIVGQSSFCSRSLQVVILAAVEEIGFCSFAGSDCLKQVIIDDTSKLTSISDLAFSGCINLEALHFSENLNEVSFETNDHPFNQCDKLMVYGPAGSYIEKFCKTNNVPFTVE